MSKLMMSDIEPDSMVYRLHIQGTEETIIYLQACFTVNTGHVIRVMVHNEGDTGFMNFCLRKKTGEYQTHLLYKFTPEIFNKYLRGAYSALIKNVSGKCPYVQSGYADVQVLELINKIRKNYLQCTPILDIS